MVHIDDMSKDSLQAYYKRRFGEDINVEKYPYTYVDTTKISHSNFKHCTELEETCVFENSVIKVTKYKDRLDTTVIYYKNGELPA